MPTEYDGNLLRKKIKKYINTNDFTYTIENKSLDARNKNNIHWEIRILISSNKFNEELPGSTPELEITYKKRNRKVVVVGSGPAGFLLLLYFRRLDLVQP